ncbi:MAG: hypothetical protein AB1485_05685, partial [Candidatus Thermoplasmatota archaeon]
MAEKTVEELTATYSRAELDKMAKELGLEPKEYPNKEAIAKAILVARKGKPPVVKIPEKIGKKGVFAKIKAIEVAVRKIGAGVKEIQKGIPEKAAVLQEGARAIQTDIQKQVKENEAAVRKIQNSIKDQAKENEAAVGKIQD